MGALERIISAGIRRTGTASAIRLLVARRRVSILMYHDPDPETFAEHLDYIAPRYNGVTLSAVVDAIRDGTWHALPDYPLVITFDDGWKGNTKIAELCRRAGFPITIFLCSAIVATNRHFWWTEHPDPESLKSAPTQRRLRVLADGGFEPDREYVDRQALSHPELEAIADIAELGAHTRFHPLLSVCDESVAWEEISMSRSEVETLVGRPCRHFAYPSGDYTEREAAMAARAGFSSARTIDVGWTGPASDPYRLRCLSPPDDAGRDRLAADLSGAGFIWRWHVTGRWDGRHPAVVPSHAIEPTVEPDPLSVP
jgi:peptidoglycan/xylan/chitin deacetylase (PgdA/CDA1 family)